MARPFWVVFKKEEKVSKIHNKEIVFLVNFLVIFSGTLFMRESFIHEKAIVEEGSLLKDPHDTQDKPQRARPFDIFEVTATAYSNDPKSIDVPQWQDGKTATMTVARWGVVAVDPQIIPLGSKVYIKNMGWFMADDTGGKINGRRIDIFYPSRGDALQFGKRKVTVLIINKNNMDVET